MKVKIRYCDNGGTKSDDLKTGTISNYRLGLKTIWIMIDGCLFENVL